MRDKNGALFIIDFGLSRQLPLRTKSRPAMRGFIGTPRYASIRAHNLLEQGKKDDLESLFYNLAYLYYRRLPWSKLTVPNDQRL
jgi:serine/threonine protein kinase